MAGIYPKINDDYVNLLKSICSNTASLSDAIASDVSSVAGTSGNVLVNGGTAAATGVIVLSLPTALTSVNSITSATGQGLALAALDGNNSITLTPSGTASAIVAQGSGGLVIWKTVSNANLWLSSDGVNLVANSALLRYNAANGYLEVTGRSGFGVDVLTNGATANARFVSTHLLLGGLTTDGTGVLQLPDGTTSAGAITLGNTAASQIFLYRYNTSGGFAIDNGATASTDFLLRSSGTTYTQITNSGNDSYINAVRGQMLLRTNGTTTALTLDTSQNAQFAKLITSYNGVATAGWGVPAIQGNGTIAATTNARSAAVATYTVGAADGTFVVSGNVNVTTATAHSFSLDCVYTDETNTSRTLVLPMAQLAGSFVATGLITNVTGAGPYESASLTIRCKAATSITIRPSAGGTYTTVVYNTNANIRQIA